jgi:hypothetical protein
MASNFKCSQDTRDRIEVFKVADKRFKEAWEVFEATYDTELAKLEVLRDDRNAKLDEAKRSLRAELEMIDEMRMTFTEGPFKVQKKFSDHYIPDKLVSMLEDRGLYDLAVSAKIVAVKVETANFDEVKNFLKLHGLEKDFECCEDGKHSPGAISGPKPIPPLGAELKKE